MNRIALLRRMGFDWAADLIETLMADKVRMRAEISRLREIIEKGKGCTDAAIPSNRSPEKAP